MKVRIENDELQISVPIIWPLQKSKSGKAILLATSHGNQQIELEGCPFWINFNAFTYPDLIKSFRSGTKVKELTTEEQQKIKEHNRKVSEGKK